VTRGETVTEAVSDPDRPQPYADLGLTDGEYRRVRQILGRRPTDTELAMYSVMWSEHCSYKSSKVHLRRFTETAPPTGAVLAGIGENAGVVDVGHGLAVTFKVESHNHPSFVEPYQGAATGVGGIVRDILAMGARPVAVMDSLRFGDAEAPDTGRLLPGVVAGIGGYGNCLGLPNIGGELGFDAGYAGNPLVNALCLGVLPRDRLQLSAATGPGNSVVLLGAKTGRDGIGGVSVLASATFDATGGPAKRPSVQVGDPFTERVLIDCCLELFEAGLMVGIQDLGGAGLTCAVTETASRGGSGMLIRLERVPLREPSMRPHEVLVSESQERMLAIVAPEAVGETLTVAARWGVPATVIGEVTDTGRLRVTWRGEPVADVPPASLADEGPVYHRPTSRPAGLDTLRTDGPDRLPRPGDLRSALLTLVASPDLCCRRWATEQYDRYVQGNTVLAMPDDAGVVRVEETSGLGVAVSLDGNGRYARLDPYAGARLALAEAYRNVATVGARPLAVTNCLNFGSPEDPTVMWQFAEAVRGLADGCRELGIPVTGGNVSFYNQTGEVAIHPTPVVGVLGVLDDVSRRTPSGFARADDVVLLLGRTRAELGGSVWAWATHRHLGGQPPLVDLAAERRLADVLVSGSREGWLATAHDLSDGGLGQALVECCLRDGVGAEVCLPGGLDPFVALFSESAGRCLVALHRDAEEPFLAVCADAGVPVTRLGLTGGDALVVRDVLRVLLAQLREAYEGTLPRLFG
jgi:phosphoribosylformylglycinamidine synthase subunit PurL